MFLDPQPPQGGGQLLIVLKWPILCTLPLLIMPMPLQIFVVYIYTTRFIQCWSLYDSHTGFPNPFVHHPKSYKEHVPTQKSPRIFWE